MPFHRNEIILGGVPLSFANVAPGYIYGMEAFHPLNTLSTTPVAGTGTITEVSGAITGVGTQFVKECRVGDTITGVGIDGTISVITDATHMTVTGSTGAGAGVGFTINPTAGVSDRITSYYDLSGNGRVFTQAAFSKKASLTSVAAGINSKRAALYDGVDDLHVIASAFLNGISGMILAVWRMPNGAIPNSGQVVFSSSDEASNLKFMAFEIYDGTGIPSMYSLQNNNDTSDQVHGGTTILANTIYCVEFISKDTAYGQRVNRTSETLVATSGANNGDWFGDTSARDNTVIGAWKRTSESTWLRASLVALHVWDNAAAFDYTTVYAAVEALASATYGPFP